MSRSINTIYNAIILYYYIIMTRKEMIIKAKRVSKELIELIECRNVTMSYDNYVSLMRNLGFSDTEISDVIKSNRDEGYIVPNNLYRHKNSIDVAFYVSSIGFNDEELECNGFWVSLNNEPNYRIISYDTIKINNYDIDNWHKIVSQYKITIAYKEE